MNLGWFHSLLRDERAATLVEWALLVVLVAIAALIGVRVAGQEVSETYSSIATSVAGASN